MLYKSGDTVKISNAVTIDSKIRGKTGKVVFVGTDITECYTVDFGYSLPVTVEQNWILKPKNDKQQELTL